MFVTSESNHDLLRLPDHSSARMVSEFTTPTVGGGLIVVNTYGDYVISVGSLIIGTLGETWRDKETMIDFLCESVDNCSEKCIATDIEIGGCGVLLYLTGEDTPKARQQLLSSLAVELTNLVNTNVLCLPGTGISDTDIQFLYKANQKLLQPGSDSDDEKKDGERRSRSLSIISEAFEFPIPQDLLVSSSCLADCAAHSAWGAISTLTKDRKWQKASILLAGLTPVSHALYFILEEKGFDVSMSSPTEDYPDGVTKTVPWADAANYRCDILVPCTTNFPSLEEGFIQNQLRCHNIVSLSNNIYPRDHSNREETHLVFEKHGIFDFCDGLCDLGAIAKIYHLSQKSSFSNKDACELGSKVMRKSLHLAKIVQQYDVEEKHNFYKIVLNRIDESVGETLDLGLGTMFQHASAQMTERMWKKAKGMCPAYRSLMSKQKKDVYYLDLGSGTGVGARAICKQNSRIHFKCVNICPQQNTENRQMSDEEGMGGQISVDTNTFERMPSEYSNLYDGCIAQDSFFHAFSKLRAFSEAYKVTKGGGWLMVSDLMSGEADDVSQDELRTFAEKNNIKRWVRSKGGRCDMKLLTEACIAHLLVLLIVFSFSKC